jgi:aminoglycoside 6'-N-acetyltransferase
MTFRPARMSDREVLELWDLQPDVIAASSDNRDLEKAFGDEHDWTHELSMQSDVYQYYVVELDGRPIGAMQVIDPHLEPTHYWGDVEPNLRALDIWIGDPADRGLGLGEMMMWGMIDECFEDPDVTAILIDPLNSNTRAHKFYQRLGFKPQRRQVFNDEDDCLVHKLTRADWLARNQGD